MIAYAATPQEAACGLIAKVEQIILFPLITLMIGVAMLVFMWGAFQFVANADNDSARTEGRRHMFYGIIGFVVIFSALSILKIAAWTFGISVTGC